MALLRYYSPPGTDTFRLERPEGVEDTGWGAIDEPLQRLNRAVRDEDVPLMIGCAKDLVEATAKVVLEARGETAPSKEDLPKLLTQAQAVLDRQPGKGLASDSAVRDIAQGALKICNGLAPLRNRYGSGHGRSEAPEVVEELALVSVDAAMLWTRWALRRLRYVILGRPDALIRDLRRATFYRGDLTERLRTVRLDELDTPDQSLLGVAVARRAMTGTFLVQEEGVEQCAQTHNLDQWPESYRIGLINGLVLDAEGHFHTDAWAVTQIALLTGSLTNPATMLYELADKCWHASLSPDMDSDENRTETMHTMSKLALPDAARSAWGSLLERVECPF